MKRKARICVILVHERKENVPRVINVKSLFLISFFFVYPNISVLATCLEPLITEYKVRSAKFGTI